MIKMRYVIVLIMAFSVLPVSAAKRPPTLAPKTGVKEVRVLVRPSTKEKPRVAHAAQIVLPDTGLYWFDVASTDSFSFQVVVYEPSAHYFTRASCAEFECWEPLHTFVTTKNPESTTQRAAIKVRTRSLLVVWWEEKMTRSNVDRKNKKIALQFEPSRRITITWRWIGEPPTLKDR